MTDLHVKIDCKDPATMGPLMIIDQVNAITFPYAAEFTSDNNLLIFLSNETVNVSEISNSDNRYGKIKLQKT